VWKVSWRAGGKVRSKTFYKATAAKDHVATLKVDLTTGRYRDPKAGMIPLAAFFEHFIAVVDVRESTKANYRIHGRKYIVPGLGDRKLATITRADVREFLAGLKADNVGASTIEHVYKLLRRVLNVAVDEERIDTNPAVRQMVKAPDTRKPRFLSAEEVEKLAEAHPERFRALVRLACWCGPRIGELAYLRVKNIDFLHRRITIEGTASIVDGRRIEGPTKTGQPRTIQVPKAVWDELVEHLERFGHPNDPNSYVFTHDAGAPLRTDNFRNRVFDPAAVEAGITPPPTVHDMRHTAASLLAQQGYSLLQAGMVLGHSTTYMTSRYTHLFPEDFGPLNEKVDAAIAKARVVRGTS